MKMNKLTLKLKLVLGLLLLYLSLNPTYAAYCNSYKDCKTCSGKSSWFSSCRWCPLDSQCRAYGSLFNSCTRKQNIVSPDKCFDPIKGEYDPGDAYMSTLLSAAAYVKDPQTCARGFSPTADFQVLQLVGHACQDLPLFEYRRCFAYTAVSVRRKHIVVAFRGTENLPQLYNQLVSIFLKPKVDFMIGGQVQAYFANAFDKLNPCVEESVRTLMKRYTNFKVIVTGHSLGAALASLTAASLVYKKIVPADTLTLYTLGLPRVGDKNYAYFHDKLIRSSWRVVHFRDIVAHLPTCIPIIGCTLEGGSGPYHHGNEIFYPAEVMNVSSKYVQCAGDEAKSCSDGYVRTHKCIPFINMQKCIDDHLNYFGIRVGLDCLQSPSSLHFHPHGAGLDEGDSDRDSRLFSNDVCNVIDVSDEK